MGVTKGMKEEKLEEAIDAIIRVYGVETVGKNMFSCKIPYKDGFLIFERSSNLSLNLDGSNVVTRHVKYCHSPDFFNYLFQTSKDGDLRIAHGPWIDEVINNIGRKALRFFKVSTQTNI